MSMEDSDLVTAMAEDVVESVVELAGMIAAIEVSGRTPERDRQLEEAKASLRLSVKTAIRR